MIISRTPYRVSFFGGGTDYHTWYQEHGGAVLSTSIDHYCYITCRTLPPFFEEKSRIVWSQIEKVKDHSEIVHPAVKGVLKYLSIEHGVEVNHSGDLPARSGLGSSSAFTVGLLNAAYAMLGTMCNKRQLACEAVHVERDILKENVGVQDQIATAYGGLNYITITEGGDFNVQPITINGARQRELQNHCMLFFTGIARTASHVAKDKLRAIPNKKPELSIMRQLVDDALEVLTSNCDIKEFGKLLHETWVLKRSLAPSISPEVVDDMYDRARAAGAIGGKLLGAGGGGFMLFFVEPEKQQAVLNALSDVLYVPFEFENQGSSIIYYDPHAYSRSSLKRRDYQHLRGNQQELDLPQPDAQTRAPLLKLLRVS